MRTRPSKPLPHVSNVPFGKDAADYYLGRELTPHGDLALLKLKLAAERKKNRELREALEDARLLLRLNKIPIKLLFECQHKRDKRGLCSKCGCAYESKNR